MILEQLPLTCGCCRRMMLVPISEVQQSIMITCARCGARVGIDTDIASRILAELEPGSPLPKE